MIFSLLIILKSTFFIMNDFSSALIQLILFELDIYILINKIDNLII